MKNKKIEEKKNIFDLLGELKDYRRKTRTKTFIANNYSYNYYGDNVMSEK